MESPLTGTTLQHLSEIVTPMIPPVNAFFVTCHKRFWIPMMSKMAYLLIYDAQRQQAYNHLQQINNVPKRFIHPLILQK